MDAPEDSYHLLPTHESHKTDSHDVKDKEDKAEKKRKNFTDADKPSKSTRTKTDANQVALATIASRARFVVQSACLGYRRVLEEGML